MKRSLTALLDEATRRLGAAGVPSPRHDAEAIVAHLLGTNRSALALVEGLDDDQSAAVEAAVVRRAAREPLQHITGHAGFRHLDLDVGPGVFIPRPETEVMTGVAIQELQRLVAAGKTPRALDLCSGSGAVAIAMGTEVPQAQVFGLEVSPQAVAYAVRNAAGTGVDIRVGDLADTARLFPDLVGLVDVVTANPPYIPMDAWESVDEEVRSHDPALALWSGDDGLDAIRLVVQAAADLVVDGGLVACEHADVQGESAPHVFASSQLWSEVRDHRDLTGRPRFITARRVRRRDGEAGTIGP